MIKNTFSKYILYVEESLLFFLSTILFISFASLFTIQEGAEWASPYIEWAKSYEIYGLIQGYYHIKDVYPPGVYTIISASQFFSNDYYFNHKLAQAIFFVVASVAAFYATKKMSYVFIFQSSIFVSQIIFSSVDIFYIAFLAFSLLLGNKGKFLLASSIFSLALLVKWQVVFLVPFICVFLFFKFIREKDYFGFFLVLFSSLIVWIIVIAVYGDDFVSKLLYAGASSSTRLSAYTFNLGWILGFIISDWSVTAVSIQPDSLLATVMQGGFVVVFAIILLRTAYFLHKKTEISFQDIILPMALGFGAFLIIYPGIHSNYWITLSPLFLFLCSKRIGYLLFCYFGVMSSINLLYVRSVLVTHDNIFLFGFGNEVSIIFSLLNVCVLVLVLYYFLFRTEI